MRILDDEDYKDILNQFFKQKHNTKLFRGFAKLKIKEDAFTMEEPFEKIKQSFNEEMQATAIMMPSDENAQRIGENEYLGIVESGFMSMNPSLIHFELKDNYNHTTTIKMRAHGAEGLIKQKTNKKAMDSVKSTFGQVNSDNIS
ncbi:hypothetical protein [Salinicoccus albus]|uniref:hypothetical protein n=1 Tax=Salinicoccus albus TaxID=418756 RepID=UPI000372797F|nr:hypothetical protein [Salinicoccus albus]